MSRCSSGSGPVRTYVKRLRSKLYDDPDSPTYIFTRNSDGNPDSPQVVVFLMSIIDVIEGL